MVSLGLNKIRARNYHDAAEALVRVLLLLLFVELEMRAPFVRKLQPEEVWLYRNPPTVSYVPGDMLWKMVALVPVAAILSAYLVQRDRADLRAATLVATLAIPLNGVLTNIIKLCVGRYRYLIISSLAVPYLTVGSSPVKMACACQILCSLIIL
jgi:hypothetical protein